MKKLTVQMSLEEASDSCVIMQAFASLARLGNPEIAQAAIMAFDRVKERYYKVKPPEPEYDGRNGYVQVNDSYMPPKHKK